MGNRLQDRLPDPRTPRTKTRTPKRISIGTFADEELQDNAEELIPVEEVVEEEMIVPADEMLEAVDDDEEIDVKRLDDGMDSDADYEPENSCPVCRQAFSSPEVLDMHMARHHGFRQRQSFHENATQRGNAQRRKSTGTGRLQCPEGCPQLISSYNLLVKHAADEHGFEPLSFDRTFENRQEFMIWLENESTLSHCQYVRVRGERKAIDGTVVGDYHCTLDGKKRETKSSRATGKVPYNRKVATRKLGHQCTAYLRFNVTIDGFVHVRGQLKHFGHENHGGGGGRNDVDRRILAAGKRLYEETIPAPPPTPPPRRPIPTFRNHPSVLSRSAHALGPARLMSPPRVFEDENLGLYEEEVRGDEMHPDLRMEEDGRRHMDDHDERPTWMEQRPPGPPVIELLNMVTLNHAKNGATASLASAEISCVECLVIHADQVRHVNSIVAKYHEITEIAHQIEEEFKRLRHEFDDTERREGMRRMDSHHHPGPPRTTAYYGRRPSHPRARPSQIGIDAKRGQRNQLEPLRFTEQETMEVLERMDDEEARYQQREEHEMDERLREAEEGDDQQSRPHRMVHVFRGRGRPPKIPPSHPPPPFIPGVERAVRGIPIHPGMPPIERRSRRPVGSRQISESCAVDARVPDAKAEVYAKAEISPSVVASPSHHMVTRRGGRRLEHDDSEENVNVVDDF